MSRDEQRREALRSANTTRARVAALREGLRDDPSGLRGLLLAPPECIQRMPLLDAAMLPRDGRRVPDRRMPRLGRMALRDGINLLLPVGRASPATRQWLADRVSWTRNGRGLQLVVAEPKIEGRRAA